MLTMLGAYRVVRQVGRGGMGHVYEAIHTQIERRAAIKVLSEWLAADRRVATRFLNEARAVNIIRHPSLVNIYEFGEHDGQPYIVMEYLDGETLQSRIERLGGQGMDAKDAIPILRQIASGLAAAHEKGIIHRDIKPQNFMIVPDPETASGERVKILDFGIAKIHQQAPQDAPLTDAGALLGTPAYMSPEGSNSATEVTDRSDVYSLGVMAYLMIAGRQPFRGRCEIDTLMLHRNMEPAPLQSLAPAAPPQLVELVHRMLAKKPTARPSAREVKEALSRIARGDGPPDPSSMSLQIIPPLSESVPGLTPSVEAQPPSAQSAAAQVPVGARQRSGLSPDATRKIIALVIAAFFIAAGLATLIWLR